MRHRGMMRGRFSSGLAVGCVGTALRARMSFGINTLFAAMGTAPALVGVELPAARSKEACTLLQAHDSRWMPPALHRSQGVPTDRLKCTTQTTQTLDSSRPAASEQAPCPPWTFALRLWGAKRPWLSQPSSCRAATHLSSSRRQIQRGSHLELFLLLTRGAVAQDGVFQASRVRTEEI